ncbi:holo-ACP synthase [Campylobacter geochelonis]|uniref:Holo-[acyl-carrier-protein] synthase n=1 Tax=Campylobacter geochelonis TaxID=1780362 RepID=A0A128EGH7_9BACT|nr:holo-ACP synthase [Campylobacter geochelonis]QKF70783.1 holo-(acyl-carrier-protein) synthase [Campylobacter geochelonis]CZE47333.1 4'-phosphopantetheinyl transferase [Campylobacter geochelonis]CZE48653.1 4'-phosphopantetheinyl transferase [Campylobacter geochelonis]CZE50552.1 4'-phosphopantetheinyl transferase [Campylobacter geochelonis]
MLGIDIVQISRISNLKEKFGDKFLTRFLCENEIKLAKTDASLAGFYAAKEAISKALGVGIGEEFSFLDVEIYKDIKGAPKLKFKETTLSKFNFTKSSLSISHDGGFAIAAVTLG